MKMKNMLKIIVILTVFVFSSCGRSENTDRSSETKAPQVSGVKTEARVKNALAFINGYVENADKMEKAAGITDWVNSNNLSTKRFKKELKRLMDEAYRKGPESGIDADPIFDAQDYPDRGFKLESFDEKTNYMTVSGINWPEFKLTMKIINENGKWLVDGCGMINIPEDKRAKR